MIRCAYGFLLAAIFAPATARAYDLVPMWESYSAVAHDSFYTENPAEHMYSNQIGFQDHGVAFWLPCSQNVPGPDGQAGANIPNLGYTSDLPMAFACLRPPGATPLYRMYKWLPATDHFYTTSTSDVRGAQSIGYTYEGVEGYVFSAPVAGSVPLYGLSVCFLTGGNCDVEHRYTISAGSRDSLVAAGWNYEGVVGYVFDGNDDAYVTAAYTGTMNGYPVHANQPVTMPIQNVSPPSATVTISGQVAVGARGQGPFFDNGYLFSNSTPRPSGAEQQRVQFTFYTGTLFDTGSNLDHIPVALYFHAQTGSDGFRSNPYDGIGIFFSVPQWGDNACHNAFARGGQVFIERFADPPETPVYFDTDDCRSNLAQPLLSRHYYDVTITADDNAVLNVVVADHSTHAVLPLAQQGALPFSFAAKYPCPLSQMPGTFNAATVYCNNPFTPDRYANFRTGYALMPMFQDMPATAGAGIGSFSGFTVQWLDAMGRVLWSR